MANSATQADLADWWACACVKGGNWRKGKPSTHIKLNAPTVKKCRVCGATRDQADAIRKGQ